jgi:FixJ family two-component response regulator
MFSDGRQALRNFTVFIIDDDQGVLDALSRFLRAAGYKTKAYSSPQAFLDEHDPSMPGCAVLDLSMPRKNGLDVQHELMTRGIERPIIFLSGRGTVPASIEAMKAGAVDFLPKPFKDEELLSAIKVAEERDRVRLVRDTGRHAASKLIDKLTPREKEVMELVVQGHLNRNIAAFLGTTERTVKEHRGRVMRKLGISQCCRIGAPDKQSNYQAAIALLKWYGAALEHTHGRANFDG